MPEPWNRGRRKLIEKPRFHRYWIFGFRPWVQSASGSEFKPNQFSLRWHRGCLTSFTFYTEGERKAMREWNNCWFGWNCFLHKSRLASNFLNSVTHDRLAPMYCWALKWHHPAKSHVLAIIDMKSILEDNDIDSAILLGIVSLKVKLMVRCSGTKAETN